MDQKLLQELVRAQLEALAMYGIEQLPRASDTGRLAGVVQRLSGKLESEPPAAVVTAVAESEPETPAEVQNDKVEAARNCHACPSVVDQSTTMWSGDDALPILSEEERLAALEQLNAEVRVCTRCPELVRNRTQTVFGVGNPKPRLCFFGEAPGVDEDRQGEPFVGRAGELLNRMIAACTLRREEVYILNVLKCRPPNNRAPTPTETENCRRFFERQLEILHPEFICCLGLSAAQALLHTNRPVGKLRGQVHNWRWAKVVVTYHPAYLLRNPSQKLAAWEDLKLLMREMGIPIPERPSAKNVK
ncbi:MAG: hypothetical protein KatS3mg110_2580 [Pirellulaceae bacterium]|nr:MAG: hypothetical protein KatS3mg110_2580 [Pirellulaceae bacterium]